MTTTVTLRLLDTARIASPCPMRWEDLDGQSDRVRRCSRCSLNVYNFSNMTADEAEALLQSMGDRRLCAGFYRRADGTVLTRDCPVGLRAARDRLVRASLRVAALLGFILTGVYLVRAGSASEAQLLSTAPLDRVRDRVCGWLPGAPPPARRTMIMGDVCIPSPRTAPPPNAPSTPQPSASSGV